MGYVAENPILYESLSPRDFLEFVASMSSEDEVTSMFNLNLKSK